MTDPTGALIGHAKVTFKGAVTITEQTAQNGSIHVILPYGFYSVTVTSAGFKPHEIVSFLVDTPIPAELSVALQLAGTNDPVVLDLGQVLISSDLPNTLDDGLPLGANRGGDLGLVELPNDVTLTGYAPSVYMQVFLACPSDELCSRTEKFHVDSTPKGCCVLVVTNGYGKGTDEVSTYEVFLNSKRVLARGRAQVAVKVRRDNTVKVILTGKPHSKVWVMIVFDPHHPS